MPPLTEGQMIEIDARWDSLPALTEFAAQIEERYTLTSEQTFVLSLTIEEIVTNIIKYGYAEAGGPLQIICGVADGVLVVRIRDRGTAFDPTSASVPDFDTPLHQRTVGGLGVFLVREMADALHYHHDAATGWNELVVLKRASNDPHTALLVDFVSRMALFANVPREIIVHLLETAQQQRLAPRERLFSEGDTGADCFILIAGEMEVIRQLDGEELLLERCQPGAIIGEMALIDNSPRAASVRARTEATLLRITEAEFMTLMHATPATAIALLRDGTARLRSSTTQMVQGLEHKNIELARAYDDLKAAQGELVRLERLEKELAIARDIHRFFLPATIPQPAGWQIAAYAAEALEVGGDFYDVLELRDDLYGIVVADACGKGVPAALFVALTRSLLRSSAQALAARPDIAPDAASLLLQALNITNDYIAREHGASHMFTTVFCGVLDTRSGELIYINAGHNPPLLIRRSTDSVVELEASGLPVGVLPQRNWQPTSIHMAADDLLLAFTDGVTEAFDSNGAIFDDARLHHELRTTDATSATALLDHIRTALATFVGAAAQTDDITILAISRDNSA